jgi:DNA-binding NtrC family response regulator
MEQGAGRIGQSRVLLVDDDATVRMSLKAMLEENEFLVTTATNVTDAIHLIDTEPYDVLLSDLHMPGAGDGFTVISAMRHKNPHALTLLFTGYPALQEAMDAILLQADEIVVKKIPKMQLQEARLSEVSQEGALPEWTKATTAASTDPGMQTKRKS